MKFKNINRTITLITFSIIFFLLCFTPVRAAVDETRASDTSLKYTVLNLVEKTAEITGYVSGSDIVIPDEVVINDNNYRVISIGRRAFYGSPIESCTLSSNIKNIKKEAFNNCKNLTEFDFGEASVTREDLEKNMFSGCESLKVLNISESNPDYTSYYGILYTKDLKRLLMVPPGIVTALFPEGFDEIPEKTFEGCRSLKTIILPNTIRCVGDYAFSGCSSLSNIALPEGIEELGEGVFYQCTSLGSITIPEGIKALGSHTFFKCTSLNDPKLPTSLTEIGEYAFSECTSLSTITIPEGITELPDNIFERCSALRSITFPEGLTSIGEHAFCDCSSLTEITLPEGLTSIGDWAFAHIGLTSVVIPESLKFLGEDVFISSLLERVEILAPLDTIPDDTFYNCKNLKEVILPNTVKVLGDNSFNYCESLQSIFIPASVETITAETFNGSYSLTEFIVDEENPWFTSEGPLLLSKDRSLLVDWPSAAGDVVLPDYISETARVLFEYQQRIRSLTFPASIKKIGGGICDDNLVLRTVYCYAVEPPEFEGGFWDIYEGRSLDITVYVPASSLELYRNNSRWNRYKLAPMTEEQSGVEALPEDGESNESDSYTVFSIDGRLLLKDAPSDFLQSLSPGIYIINGRKVAL